MALNNKFEREQAARYRRAAKKINQRIVRLERTNFFKSSAVSSPVYERIEKILEPVKRGQKNRLPESVKNITPVQLAKYEKAAAQLSGMSLTAKGFNKYQKEIVERFNVFLDEDDKLSPEEVGDFFQLKNGDNAKYIELLPSDEIVELVHEAKQNDNKSVDKGVLNFLKIYGQGNYKKEDLSAFLKRYFNDNLNPEEKSALGE